MSFLERLSNLKSGLDSENASFQAEQDNFTRDAEKMREVAHAKLEDYARNLEQAGGLGFGAIKAGQAVKSLYNKWRGKGKEEPSEEEEKPAEEEEQPTEEETGDSGEMPETEGQAETPSENIETSEEQAPEETQAVEDGPEMLDEGTEVADTSHLPSEMEMNDASNLGESQATLTNNPEGLQSTSTQNQILDEDPESNVDASDAVDSLTGDATDLATTTAEAGAEVAGDVATSVGSGILDTALIVGDAVLDAIPVVGEIAMIGTAIAGFFEGVFGHPHNEPKVVAPAIVDKVGTDATSLVSKTPVAGLV